MQFSNCVEKLTRYNWKWYLSGCLREPEFMAEMSSVKAFADKFVVSPECARICKWSWHKLNLIAYLWSHFQFLAHSICELLLLTTWIEFNWTKLLVRKKTLLWNLSKFYSKIHRCTMFFRKFLWSTLLLYDNVGWLERIILIQVNVFNSNIRLQMYF